ncbi:DMT family transporter [Frigidibacter sp. RF13]|uniref:DMT family transporter n=1 Tax=Frigidibacter sp. RF13 TaxID=2997340 RepID=UPI0022715F82|nr:DMT family transporter [Frigidibacter sp. RF13]MCY1126937.1 DMT family transporter [Frigidibacter sp. RF13]
MRERHPYFGLALAAFGALVITPDTFFMRLTDMNGTQLIAWRGLSNGAIFLLAWLLSHRDQLLQDLGVLSSPAGIAIVLVNMVNIALFSFGIATAPVSIVLFAVASMPIFAAIFAHLFAGERSGHATWIATVAVMTGIGIAVFGRDAGGVGFNLASMIGALCGLGVAAALATTFVTIRHHPALPVLPVMGLGSLILGAVAAISLGPEAMLKGNIWAALMSGALILPVSFAALAYANRHTAAVNVSLLMLLETILGPAWVWIGIGEAMSPWEIVGGAIVIVSLAAYILSVGRQTAAA